MPEVREAEEVELVLEGLDFLGGLVAFDFFGLDDGGHFIPVVGVGEEGEVALEVFAEEGVHFGE